MSDKEPWDAATAIPTPVYDLVQEITKRLDKICLREGGLLDIEAGNIPTNCKGKVTRDIERTVDVLKESTISLHRLVKEQAP